MTQSQQRAYDRYRAANTEATLAITNNVASLSNLFTEEINEWRPTDPNSVLVPSNINSYNWQQFLRTCCSTTFHTVWGNYGSESATGSGNILLINLRQTQRGDYILEYNGFNEFHDFNFTGSSVTSISSKSLVLESGSDKMLIKVLSSRINGVPVYNHQLERAGNLYANYYMVPISFN